MDNQPLVSGTPKTIDEAILNALTECRRVPGLSPRGDAMVIRNHVIDYLAQVFGVAALKAREDEDRIMELFRIISGTK